MSLQKLLFLAGLIVAFCFIVSCALVPTAKTKDGRDELCRALGVASVLYETTKTVMEDLRSQDAINDSLWRSMKQADVAFIIAYQEMIHALDAYEVSANQADFSLLKYAAERLLERTEEMVGLIRPYISDELYIGISATVSTIRIIFRQEGV